MRYYLQPALLAPPKPLRITKGEFENLAKARQTLTTAFPLEENFDLLIGNYLELEGTALSIAANDMVRSFGGYQEAFETRSTLNRRVVNLLTAARLFVDQLPQWVEACGHDPSLVRTELAARYDADFEFRFMEALRNHVQHCGSAVHGVTLGGSWLPRGRRDRQEYTVTAYTLKEMLVQDGDFKKKVLGECPEKIDLLHGSRVYIESLGAVHNVVRKMIATTVAAARDTVSSAIKRYEKFSKASSVGLTAFATSRGQVEQRVPVLIEWEKVRAELARRNGTLVNLRRRYISSARSGDDT
jgi:hypothetical protein